MRVVYILTVVCLGLSLFACQPVEDVIIDSFEGALDKTTVDFGSDKTSTVSVTAEKEIIQDGKQALKISYQLKPSGYMWVARGEGLDVKDAAQWNFPPEEINWRKYNAIKLEMYGMGKGGVVAFDLKDAGGEIWRFLLDDDTQGWKEVVCPFKHFFVRQDWQPETATKNDKLDFPIKSFQFEPRLPGDGEYYFDKITLTRTK